MDCGGGRLSLIAGHRVALTTALHTHPPTGRNAAAIATVMGVCRAPTRSRSEAAPVDGSRLFRFVPIGSRPIG